MHDLIFVSMENWDEIWRRNQFVVDDLARRFPSRKILFVGLSRDFSHAIRKGRWREVRGREVRGREGRGRKPAIVPGLPNVRLTNAPKFLPNTIPLCRVINEWMMRRHIKRAARQSGLQNPILWLNPHSAVHMIGKMNESGALYDITDDWTQFSQKDAEKQLIVRQDAALCRRADAVIVCSQRLYELKKPIARHLSLVSNGVQVEHYQGVVHRRLSSTRTPVFGYTGSIHADRVDTDLVLELARAFPEGKVLLVGPNMLPPETTEKLRAQPNISLRGAVPYAQIPQSMSEFDVCVVPHVESAFTESLNPIKLWEYLAAGKPIVSTNIAGFRDYQPLCRIASGSDAFVQACREAAEEASGDNSEQVAARQAEAAKNSWKSRVDEIVEVLNAIQKS